MSKTNAVDAFRQALQAHGQARTADYKSDGQRFYDAMSEKWRNVHYDEKRGSGYADAGGLGRITFQASGNDPAVIVTIPAIRVKADSDSMVEWLEDLSKLLNNIG